MLCTILLCAVFLNYSFELRYNCFKIEDLLRLKTIIAATIHIESHRCCNHLDHRTENNWRCCMSSMDPFQSLCGSLCTNHFCLATFDTSATLHDCLDKGKNFRLTICSSMKIRGTHRICRKLQFSGKRIFDQK